MAAVAIGLCSPVAAQADDSRDSLQKINHIVVIYQENHSFDNLYGRWEGVNGLDNAQVPQVDQKGIVLACLPQNDVNLTSPKPFPEDCAKSADGIGEQFRNKPFSIDKLIAATDTTCSPPGVRADNGIAKGYGLPGGCTTRYRSSLLSGAVPDRRRQDGPLRCRKRRGRAGDGLL